MSTPDKTIDPRLLESAKREFMKHGYLKAELKTICENADITTGAVYKRYKGKEELFCAIVQDTVDVLNSFVKSTNNTDFSAMTDEQICTLWTTDEKSILEMFRMLWELHDGFVLLISKAAGTRYENFQHDFVIGMRYVYEQVYNEAQRRGLAKADVSREEFHVLISSYWTAVYEPFIHNMTWEEIERHCEVMCRFFDWQGVILMTERKNENV